MSDHGPAEHRAKHTAPIKAVLGFLGKAVTREPAPYEGAMRGYWMTRELDAHYAMKLGPHIATHPRIPWRVRRAIAEHIEALRRHLQDVEDVADLIQTKVKPYDADPNASELNEAKAQLAEEDADEAKEGR